MSSNFNNKKTRFPECYLDLGVDVTNALSPNLDLSMFRKTGRDPEGPIDVWRIAEDELHTIFNIKWLNFLQKTLEVDITYVLIFYRTSNYFYPELHVDTLSDPLRVINYGVNFVYDKDDDSEMIWYDLDPKDGTLEDNFAFSGGLPSCKWNIETFCGKEIARKTIGRNLVLVKTSIPHTVETFSKPRWSFSIRFKDLDKLSWQDAVNKFSKFNMS